MKRAIGALALLALLLAAAAAMAGEALYTSDMPGEVVRFFESRGLELKVTGAVRPDGGSWAVAAVREKDRNTLYAFERRGGSWSCAYHRREDLPQGAPVVLKDVSYRRYRGFELGCAFSFRAQESDAWEALCEKDGGRWTVRGLVRTEGDGRTVSESIRVAADRLTYSGWRTAESVHYSGTVQNDLRYFAWSSFPKTPQDMRAKLTSAPVIPEGELTAQNIHFKGGKKYGVFSGPGERYLRGGNGKAQVSTNDWIQVFGRERGWILIQYAIKKGHMRFGWIPEESLPGDAYVQNLDFVPVAAVLSGAAALTDDPLYSGAAVLQLASGARVSWLAVMGEWGYVEYGGGVPACGFVPVRLLQAEGVPAGGTGGAEAGWPDEDYDGLDGIGDG